MAGRSRRERVVPEAGDERVSRAEFLEPLAARLDKKVGGHFGWMNPRSDVAAELRRGNVVTKRPQVGADVQVVLRSPLRSLDVGSLNRVRG
jgi:hypothetical protein